jgi:hypothetical protein
MSAGGGGGGVLLSEGFGAAASSCLGTVRNISTVSNMRHCDDGDFPEGALEVKLGLEAAGGGVRGAELPAVGSLLGVELMGEQMRETVPIIPTKTGLLLGGTRTS